MPMMPPHFWFCSFAGQTCFLPPNPNGLSAAHSPVPSSLSGSFPFINTEFLHLANSGVNLSQAPGFIAQHTDKGCINPG